MKELNLDLAAGEFDMIDAQTHLFYNIETGEFDFYNDYMTIEEADTEKFEDSAWIAAPQQQDIGEYDIMVDFAETVTDPNKNDMLSIALEGSGAFRRFKDTLLRVGMENEWYAFKRKAFIEIARQWCEDNDIKYVKNEQSDKPEPTQSSEGTESEPPTMPNKKIAVTLATLQSHIHIVDDIERGFKVYNSGGVEFHEREPNVYWVRVPHKHGPKLAIVEFTRDGEDIKKHYCDCTKSYSKPPICRHVIAAVLAIQSGVVETKLSLGKTATARTTVNGGNTAKAVGSGSLEVFATPMMVALMEKAACECLADCLDEGQTSVGSLIHAEHIAASPIGTEITASATIDCVFGRKVQFTVTASDKSGEIGKGKHTRAIVDAGRFMKNVEKK